MNVDENKVRAYDIVIEVQNKFMKENFDKVKMKRLRAEVPKSERLWAKPGECLK